MALCRHLRGFSLWCARLDSNQRPSGSETHGQYRKSGLNRRFSGTIDLYLTCTLRATPCKSPPDRVHAGAQCRGQCFEHVRTWGAASGLNKRHSVDRHAGGFSQLPHGHAGGLTRPSQGIPLRASGAPHPGNGAAGNGRSRPSLLVAWAMCVLLCVLSQKQKSRKRLVFGICCWCG